MEKCPDILRDECNEKFKDLFREVKSLTKLVYIGVGLILATNFFVALIVMLKGIK